jgi:hypothetical protein
MGIFNVSSSAIHDVKNECARLRVGATLVALREAKASPTQEFGCAIICVALYNVIGWEVEGTPPPSCFLSCPESLPKVFREKFVAFEKRRKYPHCEKAHSVSKFTDNPDPNPYNS